MILLTGATGQTGSAAADALIKGGAILRALVRDTAKAKHLADAGVELVQGDMADRNALDKALDGIDKALLIPANSEKQSTIEKGFIDAALAAGVGHVVKLSSIAATPNTPLTIPRMHGEAETHLRASGMQWTMIRPNSFMQNLIPTIRNQEQFFLPCGDGKVSFVDVRDIGAVLAAVLTLNGHENKSYDLTGPESLSFADVAEKVSAATGRQVTYVDAPPDAFREKLAEYIGTWRAAAVTEMLVDTATGSLDRSSDGVKRVLGREPISLEQFLQAHVTAFL